MNTFTIFLLFLKWLTIVDFSNTEGAGTSNMQPSTTSSDSDMTKTQNATCWMTV